MKHRRLRIAWSVAWGVMAVSLVLMWTLSYWRMDQLIQRVSATDYAGYTSIRGQFDVGRTNDPMLRAAFPQKWTRRGFPLSEWDAALRGPVAFFPAATPPRDRFEIVRLPRFSTHPFVTAQGTDYTEVVIPYWLPIFFTVAVAATPWKCWRFNLRTLMIATTLIAVGLGLIVWLIRR